MEKENSTLKSEMSENLQFFFKAQLPYSGGGGSIFTEILFAINIAKKKNVIALLI